MNILKVNNSYRPLWMLCIGLLTFASCSQKSTPRLYTAKNGVSSIAAKSSLSGTRASLVREAKKQIGSKYRYGGIKPGGFDCSGLTCYVYAQHQIALERTSGAQAKQGAKIGLDQALPGDLLFFGKASIEHVGILVRRTNAQLIMVHSSRSRGVIETDVNTSSYWRERFRFARRIL